LAVVAVVAALHLTALGWLPCARAFPTIDASLPRRHDGGMNGPKTRLPLRQRVAARRRGKDPEHDSEAVRKARRRWRMLGHALQAVGIVALLIYVVVQYRQGFRTVDYRMVLAPSAVFVAGRVIHLWLSIGRRRR